MGESGQQFADLHFFIKGDGAGARGLSLIEIGRIRLLVEGIGKLGKCVLIEEESVILLKGFAKIINKRVFGRNISQPDGDDLFFAEIFLINHIADGRDGEGKTWWGQGKVGGARRRSEP